jgi:hypothetical protein
MDICKNPYNIIMKNEKQLEDSLKILLFLGAMMALLITFATLKYII